MLRIMGQTKNIMDLRIITINTVATHTLTDPIHKTITVPIPTAIPHTTPTNQITVTIINNPILIQIII